jgi:hypothetical protein
VRLEMVTPKEYVGPLMDLATGRRGEFVEMKYLTGGGQEGGEVGWRRGVTGDTWGTGCWRCWTPLNHKPPLLQQRQAGPLLNGTAMRRPTLAALHP